MKKILTSIFIAGLLVIPILQGSTTTTRKIGLVLDNFYYQPGTTITVQFEAPDTLPGDAWIGLIPSVVPHGDEKVNDTNDIAYQYIQKRTSGTMTFTAPEKAGSYDIRLNSSDADGKELASVTFWVVGNVPEGPVMMLNQYTFKPGEEIKVDFTADSTFEKTAWIGIIPSDIPHGNETENDKHDLTYQYLGGKFSGVLIFKAPQKPGKYDFRMHNSDNNGKEVTYTTFEVQE